MRHLIISLFLISSSLLGAQQINTQIGRVTTTFDYKNSEGEKLENLFSDIGFSYAVGYRMPVHDRIFLNGDLIYNTYSAYGSDEIYGNSFSWKTEYAGLSIGAEGEVWKKQKMTLLARLDVNPQIMTKGTQLINENAFKLSGVEQFDSPYVFYRGGIGINYCSASSVALSLKYMYGLGMPILPSDDNEELRMWTSTISVGILWNFRTCQYCNTVRR